MTSALIEQKPKKCNNEKEYLLISQKDILITTLFTAYTFYTVLNLSRESYGILLFFIYIMYWNYTINQTTTPIPSPKNNPWPAPGPGGIDSNMDWGERGRK